MIDARGETGDERAIAMRPCPRFAIAAVRANTRKYNLLYNVFARPSEPITYLIANFTPLSANSLSLLAGAFGLAGAAFYAQQAFLPAAFAFAIFFLLDCCDGAIARLKGETSRLGARLDLACDRTVLVVATLVFSIDALDAGNRSAAGLCAVYLAAHCRLDWLWYRSERRFAGKPAQLRRLVAELEARSASEPPRRPGWVRNLSRAEAAIRPTPWVCNIVFLLGACLFPTAQTFVAVGATLGLVWFNRAPVLRAWVNARLGSM